MGWFNWVMLSICVVLGGASTLCFALFIALDIEVWIKRARSLRRGTYLGALVWFNVEVWGRVAVTVAHWVW